MYKYADITFQNDTFLLLGELNFFNVMSIYKKSLPQLHACLELAFDFSQLKSSDSSGLALILEWIKFASHCNKPIRFSHLSEDLMLIAQAAGIDKLIAANNTN